MRNVKGFQRNYPKKEKNKESEKYRQLKSQIKQLETEVRILKQENKSLQKALNDTILRVESLLQDFSLEQIITGLADED